MDNEILTEEDFINWLTEYLFRGSRLKAEYFLKKPVNALLLEYGNDWFKE